MSGTAATVQLNNEILRLPLGIPRMAASAALLLGDVFSYTGKDKRGRELTCKRSYQSFTKRLGMPRATVGRAIHNNKANDLINRTGNNYVCTLKGNDFLRLPQFLCVEKFKIRKIERRLKDNEQRCYAYIFTHCDNRKNAKKVCYASYARIAAEVEIDPKTVKRAIWALIRAGLIYRPKKDRGVNAYKVSRYTLNTKILRAHGIYIKDEEQAEAAPDETQATPTIDEIEQYYADKRARAEAIADANYRRARRSYEFRIADEFYKTDSRELAFAEVRNAADIFEYKQRFARARADRLVILRELGLTEEDLTVQYDCVICNDTGFTPEGRLCKCLPPGGVKPPDGGK